jgi:hypothetical protein
MHAQTDTDAAREFADIVGESQMLIGERIGPDYHHDEALVGEPVAPRFVALCCMDQIRGSRKMFDHVGWLRRTDREIGQAQTFEPGRSDSKVTFTPAAAVRSPTRVAPP